MDSFQGILLPSPSTGVTGGNSNALATVRMLDILRKQLDEQFQEGSENQKNQLWKLEKKCDLILKTAMEAVDTLRAELESEREARRKSEANYMNWIHKLKEGMVYLTTELLRVELKLGETATATSTAQTYQPDAVPGTSSQQQQQQSSSLGGSSEVSQSSKQSDQDLSNLPKERPFVCTICSKAFTLKAVLKGHMRVHTGERPYQCHICPMTFTKLCNLKQHIDAAHTDSSGRRFQCQPCNKGFPTQASYRSHVKFVHTKERPYHCPRCERSFVVKHGLTVHMKKKHPEGEESFPCPSGRCSQVYRAEVSLHMHIRKKHSDQKLFRCPDCPLTFQRKGLLNQHLVTTNYHGKRSETI